MALNLPCCAAFIDTTGSCLRAYAADDVARLTAEKRFCEAISNAWSNEDEGVVLAGAPPLLEDIEWQRQIDAACEGAQLQRPTDISRAGIAFEVELFAPLRRAIALLKRELELPDNAVWALCLDEIEFLDASHHRILNSHMRSSAATSSLKMTTMPYFHHTLETNTSAALVPGHDFEYVYLDYDPSIRGTDIQSWEQCGRTLLDKRLKYLAPTAKPFNFSEYFGDATPLLDSKPSQWTAHSEMMGLLKKFAAPDLLTRSRRLSDADFKDQISRKLHGALKLRDQLSKLGGHREHELFGGPK